MSYTGTLIAVSLRSGSLLADVVLRVTKVVRADVGKLDAGQPLTWTLLDFEVPDADAPRLADALSGALSAAGGWYCDFRNADEAFVVFPHRIFRYRRGDATARVAAEAHARSLGVPEAQLDWPV